MNVRLKSMPVTVILLGVMLSASLAGNILLYERMTRERADHVKEVEENMWIVDGFRRQVELLERK